MAGKAGGGGSGGSGQITCPTPANFDEDWAARICQKNNDCCSADITTCTTNAQTGILQLYPGLEASIAANRAAFNCDDYIACMTAINAASCTGWPRERHPDFGIPVNEPKCRTFIRPLVASGNGMNGTACTEDYQCINGYCVDPDGVNMGTQGLQCVAFRDVGLSCEAVPAAGEAHLVCNPVLNWCEQPDTNVAGVCRQRGANGAACTAANQCQSRECSTTCVAPTASACPWIPTPPTSCSVSSVGSHTSSLGWLAIAGFIGLGAAGRRRRRH
jgi:MYXO-CTERM domain-containing protein